MYSNLASVLLLDKCVYIRTLGERTRAEREPGCSVTPLGCGNLWVTDKRVIWKTGEMREKPTETDPEQKGDLEPEVRSVELPSRLAIFKVYHVIETWDARHSGT